jgi:hypothetical protein
LKERKNASLRAPKRILDIPLLPKVQKSRRMRTLQFSCGVLPHHQTPDLPGMPSGTRGQGYLSQMFGSICALSGFGTEKVESELRNLFPSAKVSQFSKAAGSGTSYDIMLTTQEILEDPDVFKYRFDRIVLVSADLMLGRPDFRATEDAYRRFLTLLRITTGEFIIQTKMP